MFFRTCLHFPCKQGSGLAAHCLNRPEDGLRGPRSSTQNGYILKRKRKLGFNWSFGLNSNMLYTGGYLDSSIFDDVRVPASVTQEEKRHERRYLTAFSIEAKSSTGISHRSGQVDLAGLGQEGGVRVTRGYVNNIFQLDLLGFPGIIVVFLAYNTQYNFQNRKEA